MSKLRAQAGSNRIDIIQATADMDISVTEIKKLLDQLTSRNVVFTDQDYKNLIRAQNCQLYLALDNAQNKRIVGMVALVYFRVPTGEHARIEDLVVDENYRGKGIGEKLMLTAINSFKKSGLTHIELTSNEQRTAANQLYKKLGFTFIHTNVYRLYLA